VDRAGRLAEEAADPQRAGRSGSLHPARRDDCLRSGKIGDLVKEVAKATKAPASEEKLLAKLVDEKAAWQMAEAQLDLLAESLRRRAAKDGPHGKYVVFCPTARLCTDLAKRLHTLFFDDGR